MLTATICHTMSIRFLSEGKFIMSASTDTSIHIWDLKGEVLASINTNQMTNSYAAISPCGRSVCQPDGFAAGGSPPHLGSSLNSL